MKTLPLLLLTTERQPLEGVWARGVCPTLETTCDMPDADEKP